MAYNEETKKAAQNAYHEARKFGHSKEEARSLRNNWRNGGYSHSNTNDEDYGYNTWNEPYDRDTIDD